MQDKISVIVPVYKVEKYLRRCLDSIVNQTYENLEIILVDDGSPDRSPEICDEYAARDSRITVIHKQNDGVAMARNSGLDVARGEYIAFVDSDDYVAPDIYEVLLGALREHDADMVTCGFRLENEDGTLNRYHEDLAGTQEYNLTDFLKKLVSMREGMGYIWNKLYKRADIGELRFLKSDGSCSEDIAFNYRFAKKGLNKVVHIKDPRYHYVVRDGSTTNETFNDGAMSIVRTTRYFVESERDNPELWLYCIKGYTNASYTVLSNVITSGRCGELYGELKAGLLKYRRQILFGGRHDLKDKIKVIVLSVSERLYNALIKKIRKA